MKSGVWIKTEGKKLGIWSGRDVKEAMNKNDKKILRRI